MLFQKKKKNRLQKRTDVRALSKFLIYIVVLVPFSKTFLSFLRSLNRCLCTRFVTISLSNVRRPI